jgi:hypothetical protein
MTMAKLPPFPSPPQTPGQKKTLWDTIIVVTPVVLTVLATILAGLSSSEMSSAQYFRSLAAQTQSKAGDQWGYFQAKKLREANNLNTLQILQGLSPQSPLDARQFTAAGDGLLDQLKTQNSDELTRLQPVIAELKRATTRPDTQTTLQYLTKGDVPAVDEQSLPDAQVADLMRAVEDRESTDELDHRAGAIDQPQIDASLAVAQKKTAAFDDATDQINLTAQHLSEILARLSDAQRSIGSSVGRAADEIGPLSSALTCARLRFDAARYARDAHFNQVEAQIYEVQVHRDGFASERHRQRSKQFFYGMLGAQAGVTIATLSLAGQRRSLLWSIAAIAGLAAISFAAYVYFFV